MIKFQCTVSGAGFGFVYIMSYPKSDKVKIGHSLDPSTRASDIGGTLAPETPILEAYYWCSERREDVERKAHEIEMENRHNGEWFKVSVKQAMNAIEKAAKLVRVELICVHQNSILKPDFKNKTPGERAAWLELRKIQAQAGKESTGEYVTDGKSRLNFPSSTFKKK